jgi:predicted amidophosphoribosyltransferase
MWKFLIACISCKNRMSSELDSQSFPLCRICQRSLIRSPPLCHKCGGPHCRQNVPPECLRPWRSESHPRIDSYSARYLLLNSGYQVLKKWKMHGGPLFDRQVLQSDDSLVTLWREEKADGVVPIPQYFHRSWKLKGCRTETIARWVSEQIQIPVIQALQFRYLSMNRRKRQAQLGLKERLQTPSRFLANSEICLQKKRVILVDDFMTTGRTLNQAAQVLKSAGAESVHVFCLGLRVLRLNSDA